MSKKLQSLLPLLGNTAAALSSFLFSLLFLVVHSPEQYAVFSFVIVFGAALQTVVNAVFVYPFASKNALHYGFDSKNIGLVVLLFLLLGSGLTYCCFQLLTADWRLSLLIALASLLLTLRFYLRATLIQRGHFSSAYSADVIYLLLTVITALLAWLSRDLLYAYLLFTSGVLLALGCYWRQLRFNVRLGRSLRFFWLNFRRFGWHSLQSACGAELLVTGISFVVIYGYGPAEYAPYALILLFFRPFTLVLHSLNQTTKYHFAQGRLSAPLAVGLGRRYALINGGVLLACGVTLVGVWLLGFDNHGRWPEASLSLLGWMSLLMLARMGRSWHTVKLQARRQFGHLGEASLRPAGICLLLMIALTSLGQPSTTVLMVLILTEVVIWYRLFRADSSQ